MLCKINDHHHVRIGNCVYGITFRDGKYYTDDWPTRGTTPASAAREYHYKIIKSKNLIKYQAHTVRDLDCYWAEYNNVEN